MKNIIYCKKCLYTSLHPFGITFNEKGICSGCQIHEEKNNLEDLDKAAEDLRLATRHLGIIVGKVDVEEILGSIFNDFCIGK